MNRFLIAVIASLALLIPTRSPSQSLVQTELPDVPEAKHIGIGYSDDGRGKIRAADEKGKVYQSLLIWENESKAPNVITYVLIGTDGRGFTATWGRGPVNLKAFNCIANDVPPFTEKALWVATFKGATMTFQEIKDDDLKALFSSLTQTRRDYNREVSAMNQRSNANTTEQNILLLMKEKNRRKWQERGWLLPVSPCVSLF